MPSVRFGGKRGFSLSFELSDDLVAVRTRSRLPVDLDALSREARDVMDDLEPSFRLAAAGVQVFRTRTRDALRTGAGRLLRNLKEKGLDVMVERASRKLRDQARRTLEEERDIQFAGRVLRDRRSGLPVLYTENVFVQFGEDRAESLCRSRIAQSGLEVKRAIPYLRNGFFLGAPADSGLDVFAAANALLKDEHVELCHPELVWEGRRRAAVGPFEKQWHLGPRDISGQPIDAHARVEEAWGLTLGEGTVIAVIDDGFDLDHEEFQKPDKIVAKRDASNDNDDPSPDDENNHGTPCAGVACAEGLHGAAGVAPRAKLMPIRLVSGLGSQQEADAIQYAAGHGADVISCSWGPKDGNWQDPDDPLHLVEHPLPDSTRKAIDWATDHGRGGRGCVVTWAAGNGNESVDLDGYASYERVMAVAACNDESRRSPYSDFGDAIWCCFPSNDFLSVRTTGIWTTDRSGKAGYNSGRSKLGDRKGHYTNRFEGTSSACPGVAGVAALVLSVAPQLDWREVRALLRDTAERIDPDGGDYDGRGHSPSYGYGRIDAARAVAEALDRVPGLAADGAADGAAAEPASLPMTELTPAMAPAAARGGAIASAKTSEITVVLRAEGELTDRALWIDGRKLVMDDGVARTVLRAGETYELGFFVAGASGSEYRITVALHDEAAPIEIDASLPVTGRIAKSRTKSSGSRRLALLRKD